MSKTYNLKELWAKMCKWEGITDTKNAKFVIFSNENPFLEEYREATKHLLKALGKWKE